MDEKYIYFIFPYDDIQNNHFYEFNLQFEKPEH